MRSATGKSPAISGYDAASAARGSSTTTRPSRAAYAAKIEKPAPRSRLSAPQSATRRPAASRTRRAASVHCAASTRACDAGTAPGSTWRSRSMPGILISTEETRRLRVPGGKIGGNVEPEHERERQVHEHRGEGRLVSEWLGDGIAEHHRLHAAENRGERHPQRGQQDGRGPRVLPHRRGGDQEPASEYAEGRHAQDGA